MANYADRLHQQIQFIVKLDSLKSVVRKTYVMNSSRLENAAEHSWYLTVAAMVLVEYSEPNVNIDRVIRLLIIHDVVEIYAGDTYIYDNSAVNEQYSKEKTAADKLFDLLPKDQTPEFRSLWEEYEAQLTSEAIFARLIDRLMPLLANFYTQGKSWKENGITSVQVISKYRFIKDISPTLWGYVQAILNECVNKGYFSD